MSKIKSEKLLKRTQYPRDEIIQFRISEQLYNEYMMKANEYPRFYGKPGLYIRHLVEEMFRPTDEKSIMKLCLVNNELLQKLNNKIDLLQGTEKFILQFDIGHHAAIPEEDRETHDAISNGRFKFAIHLLARNLIQNGSLIHRRISELMIDKSGKDLQTT